MIRNIIFDIGNVLTDFRWRGFLADKGFSPEMIERIARASVHSPQWAEYDRGVLTDEEVLESFVRNDPEIERELHAAFDDFDRMVTPRAYACPWIRELRGKGYRVYYLSNFSHKAEAECPEALDFIPLMDGGILSYKDKLIKPDPAIYKLLLARYELEAEECVFIDDTQVNVEAARKLGIQGIVFESKEQAEQELSGMGVALE